MKHYNAIRCIKKRIEELDKEILISTKIMDEPEMLADYYFALNDLENFHSEITELQQTIAFLLKSTKP